MRPVELLYSVNVLSVSPDVQIEVWAVLSDQIYEHFYRPVKTTFREWFREQVASQDEKRQDSVTR